MVLAASGQVHAAGWNADFDMRLYLGAGGGKSVLKPDTSRVENVDVIDETDVAQSVTIGVDIGRQVGVEFQYVELGAAKLTGEAEIDYSEMSVSGLYYLWNNTVSGGYQDYDGLDLRHGLSFFGRAGLGKMENSAVNVAFERANDYQFLAGLGVEYALRNGLAARLEYTAYDTDVQHQGLTLLYRFGGGNAPSDAATAAELPSLPAPAPIMTLPPPPPPPPTPVESPIVPEPAPTTPSDSDADGVIDFDDVCPDTLAGMPVNSSGCELFNGVIDGVNFQTGSATLTALARATLDEAIVTLDAFPDVRISVQAHTDSMGNEDNNLELSKQRALSVVRYLTAQGVGIDRLEARAYGERRPIADNSTREGRLTNRRVEFRTIP